jgi:hypothetical protein
MSDATEQWGPWTDGMWVDVQAHDEIDKGRIWYVTEVDGTKVSMVPTEARDTTPKVGVPPMGAPVRYRRAAEPVTVVAERRPEMREIATTVLDELAEARRAPSELQTKIEEIINDDPPVERAGWIEREARDTGQSLVADPIEDAAIAAAEGYPVSPVPFSDLDAARLQAISDRYKQLDAAVTEAYGALAAGLAPAAIGAVSAIHVAFGALSAAYGEALAGMVSGPVDPDAGDMSAERAVLNDFQAAELAPVVIERVLSYPDICKHLTEDHGMDIPALGKRTKLEARKELADLHYGAHEHEQVPGHKWQPRGDGRPHVHPVMDRPMPPGAV